ncbi:MAG TPA: hypothetical protein VFJ43_08720 [Bacteroidia bacterium]|nr:hypothetical protein [Bacteroidia bacterium]
MKKNNHSHLKEVHPAILLMPEVAKEQERLYFEDIKFANKTFGSVIRQILKLQKASK